MEIIATEKINNNFILVEYDNGNKEKCLVFPIPTRKQAIDLYKKLVQVELTKPDAYDNLHKFTNNFEFTRNYEIEDYLRKLTNKFYFIVEKCPFNGFSWFDA